MANRADMNLIEVALLATASAFIALLTAGKPAEIPSGTMWQTCGAAGEPLIEVAAFMHILALSFTLLCWCTLAMLDSRGLPAGDLGRTLARLSLAFAAVAGIAYLETAIGVGPLWCSRLHVAGGGWTFLMMVAAAYSAAMCKVWRLIRVVAMTPDSVDSGQVLGVDTFAGPAVIFAN